MVLSYESRIAKECNGSATISSQYMFTQNSFQQLRKILYETDSVVTNVTPASRRSSSEAAPSKPATGDVQSVSRATGFAPGLRAYESIDSRTQWLRASQAKVTRSYSASRAKKSSLNAVSGYVSSKPSNAENWSV